VGKVLLVVSHGASFRMVHFTRPGLDPYMEAARGAVSHPIPLESDAAGGVIPGNDGGVVKARAASEVGLAGAGSGGRWWWRNRARAGRR
jgi:hypothetical protein